MQTLLIAIASIALSVAAQFSLKAGMSSADVRSKWDISKAYPLGGLGFGLTVVVGLLAGEQVTMLRAAGVALIGVGFFLVSKS